MEELFYKLFEEMPRLGPGSTSSTLRALNYIEDHDEEKKVLDIGCGTGAQTFVLAKALNGKVIALDNHQPYLDQIEQKAKKEKLKASIECYCMDMKKIVCKHESLDLVWAEGSIYIVGFEKGLNMVSPLLKKGAYVVFSDMNYLKKDSPPELVSFFKKESPDMISKKENIELIDRSEFRLIDHFELERDGHWEAYYEPLQQRVQTFSSNYSNNDSAIAISYSVQEEIELYKKYEDFYGYVFYIMQKK